jgi:hypothetical protein
MRWPWSRRPRDPLDPTRRAELERAAEFRRRAERLVVEAEHHARQLELALDAHAHTHDHKRRS